jgi:predicted O-methyltransferase YrrM
MFKEQYDITKRTPVTDLYQSIDAPINIRQPSQSKWEFTTLLEIIEKLKPKNILEIGSLTGATLWHWFKLVNDNGIVISIDVPVGKDMGVFVDYSEWTKWAKSDTTFHYLPLNSHSSETQAAVYEITQSLDFLFIDGDHSYVGIKSDFLEYGPLVKSGGIIALHDISIYNSPNQSDVSRFWKEIREAGYTIRELYSQPGQDMCGIGVIFI